MVTNLGQANRVRQWNAAKQAGRISDGIETTSPCRGVFVLDLVDIADNLHCRDARGDASDEQRKISPGPITSRFLSFAVCPVN